MPRIPADRAAQIARYLTVGVLSAIADIGGLWLLHGVLGVWLPLAAALSFLASFAVNFTLNQRWTFGAQTAHTPAQLVRFTILVAVNTVLTSAGVTALAAVGLNYLVAKVIVVCVLTVLNFVVLRLWVFRSESPAVDG
jgi:putative flippase GtrA